MPDAFYLAAGDVGPKHAEELLYGLFFVLGSALSFLGVFVPSSNSRTALATLLAAAIMVAFAPSLAHAATYAQLFAVTTAIPAVACLAALAFEMFSLNRSELPSTASDSKLLPSVRVSLREAARSVLCIAFFAACLLPADVGSVAARIGYDRHPVSFYIGPALFLRSGGALPGIDFFPQYGIGIGYLFSYFLRPTVQETMANVVLVTAVLSLVYFATAFLVLRRLYGSLEYALAVTAFALVLNFHTQGLHDVALYIDPSSWPARYPFIFLFVWLFARASESRRQTIDLFVAGGAAGLCLFWNTETGIYCIVGALLGTLLMRGTPRTVCSNLAANAGGTVVGFFLLSAIAYGPSAFGGAFVAGLIKPLTVYAGGLGAAGIAWTPLNVIYAVLTPLIAAATVGWSAAMLMRQPSSGQKEPMVTVFLLSVISCGLMLKWLNMSLDALWYVNALPIIAVTAWWIRVALQGATRRFSRRGRTSTIVVESALLALMVIFVAFAQDARNPSRYAFRAFLAYPSLLLAPAISSPRTFWDPSQEASASDVALIEGCSMPSARVTVIANTDWVYLLAADRAPKMPWIPSVTMSTFPFLVDGAMRDPGPIFMQNGLDIAALGPPLSTALTDRLRSRYRLLAAGNTLQLFWPNAANAPPSPGCLTMRRNGDRLSKYVPHSE